MDRCIICRQEQALSGFSRSQRKKKRSGNRKCIACIFVNKRRQVKTKQQRAKQIQWSLLQDSIECRQVTDTDWTYPHGIEIPVLIFYHNQKRFRAFSRCKRRQDARDVLLLWRRRTSTDVVEDVISVIVAYFDNTHGPNCIERDDLVVHYRWIKGAISSLRTSEGRVNQLKLFNELRSHLSCHNIIRVTLSFKLENEESNKKNITKTKLELYFDGSYLFQNHQTTDGCNPVVTNHCGVWNYKNDEIIMDGFGFESWVPYDMSSLFDRFYAKQTVQHQKRPNKVSILCTISD